MQLVFFVCFCFFGLICFFFFVLFGLVLTVCTILTSTDLSETDSETKVYNTDTERYT